MQSSWNRPEAGHAIDLMGVIENQLATAVVKLFELGGVLTSMVRGTPPRIGVLEYRQVVEFFVGHRHAVPDAAAAALVRQKAPKSGVVAHLVFLDAAGVPINTGDPAPPSRTYLVDSFDEELRELFGTSDIIVFD